MISPCCAGPATDRDAKIRQLRTEIVRMQPVVASVERLVKAGHAPVTLENAADLVAVAGGFVRKCER
jgi:hypothetical protein